LRPGMIHEAALVAVVGRIAVDGGVQAGVLKSPGLLGRHYSPRARLVVWLWQDEAELRRRSAAVQTEGRRVPLERIHVVAHTRIPAGEGFGRVSVIPHDAEAFARALYAELHQCDAAGAELIVVEALPETSEWRALADRLNRAAAGP